MSKSLATAILYRPFIDSKSERSKNQCTSDASRNNEGYARDDNDCSNSHRCVVLPQPLKRNVNI